MAVGKLTQESKRVDEVHQIAAKRGNGLLRREIWVDDKGHVIRYNLAYVNLAVYAKDNGRVVGYDNQHGYYHRHFMGKVTPVDFENFEQVENLFEQDWLSVNASRKAAKKGAP
jgi:hypothetical protein